MIFLTKVTILVILVSLALTLLIQGSQTQWHISAPVRLLGRVFRFHVCVFDVEDTNEYNKVHFPSHEITYCKCGKRQVREYQPLVGYVYYES